MILYTLAAAALYVLIVSLAVRQMYRTAYAERRREEVAEAGLERDVEFWGIVARSYGKVGR